MIRWGHPGIDEIREGNGGWGDTGSVVADRYISTWLDSLEAVFGQDCEVITSWCQVR